MIQASNTEKAIQFVSSHEGVTAAQVSKFLSITKSEANSILYKNLGISLRIEPGKPPKWFPINQVDQQKVGVEGFVDRRIAGDIHVDFPGGDWVFRVQIAEMSRNDPISLVEKTGERSCLITVSKYVVSELGSAELSLENRFPDSVIAIAAASLAWEISQTMSGNSRLNFDFAGAITNIYLAITAHTNALSK